jgi:hypothetical protein
MIKCDYCNKDFEVSSLRMFYDKQACEACYKSYHLHKSLKKDEEPTHRVAISFGSIFILACIIIYCSDFTSKNLISDLEETNKMLLKKTNELNNTTIQLNHKIINMDNNVSLLKLKIDNLSKIINGKQNTK